jgi:predicted nucleic acid-binding Zn ribbon protein
MGNHDTNISMDLGDTMTVSRQREWQLKMEEAGLCRICGKPARKGNKLCGDHVEKAALQQKERRARLKAENKCVVCKQPAVPGGTLCLKHGLANNGNNRKRNRSSKTGGGSIYREVAA